MHRLIVVILAALDALIIALAGLAAVFAPLLVFWLFGMNSGDVSGLWGATAMIWQLGHLVPVDISLPAEALALAGISDQGASFVVSLAPLAFAVSTFIAAFRSGARGVRAGGWPLVLITGTVSFAVIAVVVEMTSGSDIATTATAAAVLLPPVVFFSGAAAGVLRTALRDGDGGLLDRVSDALSTLPLGWRPVARLVFLGAGVVGLGLTAVSGVLVVIAAVSGTGDAVALFQSLHVDVFGATALFLAQLAYLPTLIIWAASWLVGPGFAVGAGTGVAPGGTTLGVVPGLPVFGFLPETAAPLLLLVALIPVALGALAGWLARAGFMAVVPGEGHLASRVTIAAGIAVVSGTGFSILAVCASGGIGPGRMATLGPDPVAVGVALGVEVLIGALVLLLAPVRREDSLLALVEPSSAKAEGSLSD